MRLLIIRVYIYMSTEEVAVLAQKIKEGTSTQEEELALLRFINGSIEELRTFIKTIKADKE